jgi:DNA repair protein RadC
MQAILENNLTHFTQYYDKIEVNKVNPIFSQINLNLANLEEGEYTLLVMDNLNQIILKELIKIGTNNNNKRVRNYIQYVR